MLTTEKNNSKKLLFLYLKTGGGHLAPAKAVATHIQAISPDTEVSLFDGLNGANRLVRYFLEDGYRISQNKVPFVFEALYAINKIKPFAKSTSYFVSRFIEPQLEKELKNSVPDKIVIYHFFLIEPVKRILKRLQLKIPVLTVVTDPYTAHPIWFLDKEQKFVVFSNELKSKLIDKLPEENLQVFPFIINDKFNEVIPVKEKLRIQEKLGFETNKKTILILGGADGIFKGKTILKNLLSARLNAQIAIVCGRNKDLYNNAMEWKTKYNAKHLHVFGFVNFVHELINVSDVVITKCGASTFMEILMSKKVPVISNYLWEQEKGNMEFITQNNLGFYEKRSKKLPGIISELLENNTTMNKLRNNINSIQFENGTEKVSNYILEF